MTLLPPLACKYPEADEFWLRPRKWNKSPPLPFALGDRVRRITDGREGIVVWQQRLDEHETAVVAQEESPDLLGYKAVFGAGESQFRKVDP